MDFNTGRANHIEDFLVRVRTGQWFGWSDSKNKIYANLIVHDGGSKPTEQECIDGLAQLQTEYDAQDYARKRKEEYPSIEECVHAILDDDLENLQILRQAVKNKFPKENA
jgi:hypothetical protein